METPPARSTRPVAPAFARREPGSATGSAARRTTDNVHVPNHQSQKLELELSHKRSAVTTATASRPSLARRGWCRIRRPVPAFVPAERCSVAVIALRSLLILPTVADAEMPVL